MHQLTNLEKLRAASRLARAGAIAAGLVVGLGLFAPTPASARIRVAASITDLGSIAAAVGGDHVEVGAIARSNTNVHRVEILPSYMVRVSRADVYLRVGLGLDQWADQIIDGSHNGSLRIVDCSQGIEILERPTGRVDASMGDIHPSGNPHYWLHPLNGAVIARTVARVLSEEDPAHAAEYAERAESFAATCREAAARGRAAAATLPVKEIVTYHRSWSYLADAFGLRVVGEVEPLPGIPPTGKHLQKLVSLIREHGVPLLIVEPYFSDEVGKFLARETGITVARLSPHCDGVDAGSYLKHFDTLTGAIAGARS